MKKLLLAFYVLGFLLMSKPVAAQWTKLTTAVYPAVDLNDVYANGSKIIAVGTSFPDFLPHIFTSLDSGKTWDTTQINPKGYFFKTIAFKDNDTGYIGGYGSITIWVRTTDGGQTWTYYAQDMDNSGINDMVFLTDKIGYASGYAYNQFSSGQCYKTIDGGNNWTGIDKANLGCLDTLPMDFIHFVDPQIGYGHSDFLGRAGMTKTTDGGQSWSLIYTHTTSMVGFHFYNAMNGVMVDANGDVYKSTDGGYNWTKSANSIAGSNVFLSMAFQNQFNGVIVGDGGKIYKTTDGGNTWTKETAPAGITLLRVRFWGERAYAVGRGGYILRSGLIPNNVSKTISLKDQLNIYPNPASGTLNISAYKGNNKRLDAVLMDMNGRVVKTAADDNGFIKMDVATVPPGTYTISISADGHKGTDVITIAH